MRFFKTLFVITFNLPVWIVFSQPYIFTIFSQFSQQNECQHVKDIKSRKNISTLSSLILRGHTPQLLQLSNFFIANRRKSLIFMEIMRIIVADAYFYRGSHNRHSFYA